MCIHFSKSISCKSFSRASCKQFSKQSPLNGNQHQIQLKQKQEAVERIQFQQKQKQSDFDKAFDWTEHSMRSGLNINWLGIQQRWQALDHTVSRIFSAFSSFLYCFNFYFYFGFFCFDCFAARWLLGNWDDDEWKRERRSFLDRIRGGALSKWRYVECRKLISDSSCIWFWMQLIAWFCN